ncbi:MAG: GNAT family N-acetyltransferase [Clostridia bacterium]|nr:GNAT family N-acetyltransferase [Clostridia bacterium]
MNNKLSLRPARPDEREELGLLWAEAFEGDPEDFFHLLNISDVHVLVCEEESIPCGMTTVVPVVSGEIPGVYLFGVCLQKRVRGRGLFRPLMSALETYAAEHGARFCCLIPGDEGLSRTYEAFGYTVPVARFSPSVRPDGHAVHCESNGFLTMVAPDDPSEGEACDGRLKRLDAVTLPDNLYFIAPMGEI